MSHAVGRLAVEGWSPRDLPQAQRLLGEGLRALPRSVEYLVGPGGYVTLYAPVSDFESGWGSSERLPESLEKIAHACAKELVSGLSAAERAKARYFSFGLDIRDDSPAVEKHAELVVVTDLRTGKLSLLTGKTYPTDDQARTLIRAADWRSHLWTPPNGDRVIVLGCHDFNVYSNRAMTNAAKDKDGERFKEIQKARALFEAFGPTHVLHHPHGTDLASTWRVAYSGVKALHPRLEQAVSGIGHPRFKSRENDDTEVVLAATQTPACASVDVVVRGNAGPTLRQADAIPRSLDTAVSPEEKTREDAKAQAGYERGMAEWRHFEKHGVPTRKGARTTKPAPPPKPHRGIKTTAKNPCP